MVTIKSLRSGLVKRIGNANWRQWVAAGVLTTTILGGLTVWATFNHGSVGRFMLVWSGIRVHVPAPVVNFDTLQEGRTYEAKVGIENLGTSPNYRRDVLPGQHPRPGQPLRRGVLFRR